jgi:hypothetical protein
MHEVSMALLVTLVFTLKYAPFSGATIFSKISQSITYAKKRGK